MKYLFVFIMFVSSSATADPAKPSVIKAKNSKCFVKTSDSEISLLDIEKGKFEFGVVGVNCQTGKLKGYRKEQPTLITGWWSTDDGLDIWEGLNLLDEKLP